MVFVPVPLENRSQNKEWSVNNIRNDKNCCSRGLRSPMDVFDHSDAHLPLPSHFGLSNLEFSENLLQSGNLVSGFSNFRMISIEFNNETE